MRRDSALDLKNQLMTETSISRGAAARASELGVAPSRSRRVPAVVPASRAPMAIGIVGKKNNYRIAVRVQDRSPGMEVVLADIHKRARGETDVRVVGPVRKQVLWHQRRNRPLRIGGSVGHFSVGAGTLGCFVTQDGETDLILSNNHVLADENRGKKGDAILQQGVFDGGKSPTDRIGTLADFVQLRRGGNFVDCALATIDEGIEYFVNELDRLGPIRGIRQGLLEEGETVYKVGRTTGYEEGRISAIEIDGLIVDFDMGSLTFDSQIEIEPRGSRPFSLGGDSGSLIVDSERRAIGLLFAGNDVDATYANDIHLVLDSFGAKLVH